jgi:DNA-directed RNA polymerase subunit H (RpoH/RPB5)
MATLQLHALSLTDLSMVRLFKVFSTVQEMVEDRGYSIKRPKCIATSKADGEGEAPLAPGAARGALPRSKPLDFAAFEREFVVDGAAVGGAPGGKMANREAMTFRCKRSRSTTATVDAAGERDLLMVFFSEDSQLSVNKVLELRKAAQAQRATHMIIVTSGTVMPATRRDVTEMSCRIHRSAADDDADAEEDGRATELGRAILSIQVFEEQQLTHNITRHSLTPRHVPLGPAEAAAFLKRSNLTVAELPRMLLADPAAQYYGLGRGQIVKIVRKAADGAGTDYDMYRQII